MNGSLIKKPYKTEYWCILFSYSFLATTENPIEGN